MGAPSELDGEAIEALTTEAGIELIQATGLCGSSVWSISQRDPALYVMARPFVPLLIVVVLAEAGRAEHRTQAATVAKASADG